MDKNEILGSKVRELIDAGLNVRQIAAETGQKYVHVKKIYDQEMDVIVKNWVKTNQKSS